MVSEQSQQGMFHSLPLTAGSEGEPIWLVCLSAAGGVKRIKELGVTKVHLVGCDANNGTWPRTY